MTHWQHTAQEADTDKSFPLTKKFSEKAKGVCQSLNTLALLVDPLTNRTPSSTGSSTPFSKTIDWSVGRASIHVDLLSQTDVQDMLPWQCTPVRSEPS